MAVGEAPGTVDGGGRTGGRLGDAAVDDRTSPGIPSTWGWAGRLLLHDSVLRFRCPCPLPDDAGPRVLVISSTPGCGAGNACRLAGRQHGAAIGPFTWRVIGRADAADVPSPEQIVAPCRLSATNQP